ncbi:MAG: CRISPR system precrRNA processing endoribonuclease RAMP protein Cas6 [Pseudomonadota bacterium]
MLRISRYRFRFHAQDPIQLPPFPGSAIRGIFGHGLKRSVCVTRLKSCGECLLRNHCVYSYLFETHLTLAKGDNAPQPLVLDVHQLQRRYEPGVEFSAEATLVGHANRHLPYLIQAWQRAGQRGLGGENARFELSRVDALDFQASQWQKLYPVDRNVRELPEPFDFRSSHDQTIPEQARIDLLTPYRGKRKGRLVTPASFDIQGFTVSLIRRIANLQRLHDPDYPPCDVPKLIHATADLSLTDANLKWREWTRHSSRQHTQMQMGGVVGGFSVSGEGLRQLWPGLQLGQWIQAGKNTLFGLGRYQIQPQGIENE